MAYICSSCNKFASVDVECDEATVEGEPDGLDVSVELRLVSQCCSDTVAEATAEGSLSIDIEHGTKECEAVHEEGKECDCDLTCDEEWLIEGEPEPTDWYYAPARKDGKPTPMRYQKHFYGADVTVTVSCTACGVSESDIVQVGEQASSFESY